MDEANPEPYEQLGRINWGLYFNPDGSDLVKAEKAFLEAIKRGGKAVIRAHLTDSKGWPKAEITISITATKCTFSERTEKYSYETDYNGLVSVQNDNDLIVIYYPKEAGKFFKATGEGKPKTRELKFNDFLNEERKAIYLEVFKLPRNEKGALPIGNCGLKRS